MKIGIIGASGKAGSFILKESLNRGHEVTAIVRDATKVQDQQVLEKSIFNLTVEDIRPFDILINAFKAPDGQEHQHVEAAKYLIELLKGSPKTKLIVVGGAGSLFVDEAKTVRVFETPDFPEAYLQTALNMGKGLEELQNAGNIQWTYISPAGFFDPEGSRTGSYVKGKDQLILNSKGESYISYADYAIAVVDEIENEQHKNERFTVVGEN